MHVSDVDTFQMLSYIDLKLHLHIFINRGTICNLRGNVPVCNGRQGARVGTCRRRGMGGGFIAPDGMASWPASDVQAYR